MFSFSSQSQPSSSFNLNWSTLFIAVSGNDLRTFDPLPFLNRCGYSFQRSHYYGGLAFLSNLNYVDRNVTHIIFRNSTESSYSLPGIAKQNYHKSLAHRKAISMRYFIEKTNASYYALIAEDTHIYVENLEKLFYYLTHIKKINPYTDPLVVGNCLYFGTAPPFIQGGSGYLLSRRSAQDFLKIEQQWRNSYDGEGPEDFEFIHALELMNYSLKNISSPFFLGQYCMEEDKPYLEAETIPKDYLEKLPICPRHLKNPPNNSCNIDYVRLRDIVFLHRLSRFRPWGEFKPMSHYPDNLYFTMQNDRPTFCLHKDIMGKNHSFQNLYTNQ